MRRLSKLAAWIVVVALVASLFSGVAPVIANAETASPLSETYTEATDFMTHYLVDDAPLMDNSTSAWTDLITVAEVNKVIDALLYKSLAKYNWSHPLFAEGETVSGNALLTKAQTYIGWSYRALDVLIPYFRLIDGIENYNAEAALTREQAAQLFLNVLRAVPEYAWNGSYAQDGVVQAMKLNDDELGLSYEVTRDNMGRPSYQWKHNGVAITDVYAAEPILVSDNTATTQGAIMNALGYTPTIESSWHYPMNKFGVNLINEGSAAMTGWYFINGDNGNTIGGTGMTVAVYDAYYVKSYVLEGNYFCSRMYDVVTYWDLLADVKTEGESKTVNMYGQVGGYGYWGGQTNVQNVEDGKYIVRWNGIYAQVQDVTKAEFVAGKLAAYTDASITIGDKAYAKSPRMYVGLDLLTAENIDKVFTFYLDTLGNVIGMEVCDHSYGSWKDADATNHARTCDKCGWADTAAHEGELRGYLPPSVTAPGYSGDTYCKYCNRLMAQGTDLPQSTCSHPTLDEAVKENDVPNSCGVPGGYDMVVYCHDCHTKISSVHTDLPALEHDWEETANEPAGDRTPGYIDYVCKHDPNHTKHEDIPALLAGKTSYPEAVELLKAMGIGDTANDFWTDKLTGAEANKILQALYDGPGFVAQWSPDFAPDATVTGPEFISDALVTIDWSYGNDTLFGNYHNLTRGLGEDYSDTTPLTREQAAQILLNVLKAIPSYNAETLKGQDPGLGLTLVKVEEDTYHRPSYKWQKVGVDVTDVYADAPIAKIRGGATWNEILNAVNYITDPGITPAQFRWSQEGGDFTDWVTKVHGDETTLLDDTYVLEIYYDYSTARTGYEYSIIAYRSDEVLPGDVKPDTKYPEAVELMIAIGLMEDGDWKTSLTGAEANKILEYLYDGPGFVAEWHPDFSAAGKVKASEFISDALVTIGWNYGNDPLWAAYNHLEKGLKGDYKSTKNLTREEAAQIVLNVFKAIPVYNTETIKANDPGIGLTLVKTKEDSVGRPYYKWQRNGVDITDAYRDTPVTTMYGGIIWSDILTAVGDVGDANFEQFFRVRENGGKWSSFSGKMHPNYDIFKTADWAVEIFLDYDNNYTTYAYSIVTYEGALANPDTGVTNNVLPAAIFGILALGGACTMLIVDKKKRRA